MEPVLQNEDEQRDEPFSCHWRCIPEDPLSDSNHWCLRNCLQVSNYIIFQNGILVKNVPVTIFTSDFIVDNFNTYNYFIIAFTNGSNISEPSDTVSISISY